MNPQPPSAACSDSDTHEASPFPPPGPPPCSQPTPAIASSGSSTITPSRSNRYTVNGHPPPLTLIPIHLIDLETPNNGRAEISETNVQTLADLIAHHGLINPITLRPNGDRYLLVAGNTRRLAYIKLGREVIAATVLDIDAKAAALIRLAENTGRTQLTPVDEAMQLAAALEARGGDTAALADAVGHSPRWVEDRLDILTYDPELIAQIHLRKITLAAAKHLNKIPDADTRRNLITQAAEHGITATTAAQWLQQTRTEESPLDAIPENGSEITTTEYKTTTTALCFVCREHVDLHKTHSARVCDACINDLMNPPQNPAIPEPPQHNAPNPHAQTPRG